MKFKEKKVRIEAFSVALMVLVLLASSCIVHPVTGQYPESHYIQRFWNTSDNLYHGQPTGSNMCGPACVEMALAFFNITIDQTTLAKELNATDDGYTMSNNLHIPFDDRSIKVVYDGILSNNFTIALQLLKENISVDNPAILLMWYSATHGTGHYRLVIGYNQTGLFFHDPLDGPNEYFANELVENLWNYSLQNRPFPDYALILNGTQPVPEFGSNSNVYGFLLIILATSIIISSIFYAKRHHR